MPKTVRLPKVGYKGTSTCVIAMSGITQNMQSYSLVYIDYSRAQRRLRENKSDTRRRSSLSYQIKSRWTCLDTLYARPVSTTGSLSMSCSSLT
jgi:hypothetical protein